MHFPIFKYALLASLGLCASSSMAQGGNSALITMEQIDTTRNNTLRADEGDNTAAVRQDGTDNVAEIAITGAENTARIRQNGHLNTAAIGITGAGNGAHIDQTGDANRADLTIEGRDNSAQITQGSPLTGVVFANRAQLIQSGDRNTAAIAQFGHDNDARLTQTGQANSGSITQTADGNFADLTQDGTNLSYDIVQSGGEQISVSQSGGIFGSSNIAIRQSNPASTPLASGGGVGS